MNNFLFCGKKLFPCAITMKVQTLLIFTVLTFVIGDNRRIISKLNPGCQDCKQDKSPLIYIRSDGSEDTIHQIWDFTRGIPTMIFAIGSLNSSLTIGWERSVPVMFLMSEVPWYSFAAAIDKIYEYDDLSDVGHIDPKCPQKEYSLGHLSWRLNDSVLTDKEAMVVVRGQYRDERRSGTVDMKLDILPFKDYAKELPHLIHTANSTLIDIRLVNLTTSIAYNASRFALHFLLVSTDSVKDSWNVTMRKSMDDEHTPGVFEIIEIKSPKSSRNDSGGFLQFRPVAYTDPEREVSSSTNAHISTFNRTSIPLGSTLKYFYRGFDEDQTLVQDMFISFGLAGDGFYKQHNFTAWSLTLGYGAPPMEGFSLFVIIVICIGLGVPVLLAVSGIAYVLSRRCKQRNSHSRFTNDE